MQSRVILIGILVLAVSLTLAVKFFQRGTDGPRPLPESARAQPVATPNAPDPNSTPVLAPAAADTSERPSARTPSADATAVVAETARLVVITGRLVTGRGEGVAEARVFVAPEDRAQGAPLENLDPTRLAWARRVETFTDERGGFRLTEVPEGRSRLAARSKGHAPHDAVIVVTEARYDIGDIVLEESVLLSGRVLDQSRSPVSGASLRRLSSDASPAVILGDSFGDIVATTDDEGRFHIDELGRGPWVLLIKAASHPARIEKGETKSSGQIVSGLEFVLDDGAEIQGRVVNAPPGALEDLWITAVPKVEAGDGHLYAGDRIDEKRFLVVPRRARCAPDGSFTIAELTADLTYRLAAHTGEHAAFGRPATKWVEARAGDRKVELLYQPETALVFQAVDALTAQPVTGMEVHVGERFMLPLTDEKGLVKRTFPEGRARFENVFQRPLEEHAELVIEARGYTTLRVGDLRPVAGRDLDLGVLRLARAPMVFVRVVDASTQEPVVGARVALIRYESDSPASSSLQEGVTDADGRVRLNSLPGETAFLGVFHPGHAPHRSEPLALARAGDREETIALNAGGTVVVLVKDTLGAAVRGVRIEHRILKSSGYGNEVRPTIISGTDANGELRLEHLPAGPHRFAAAVGRASSTNSTSNSADVEVLERGEHTVTLVVPQRARVTGRVIDSGQPSAGATLHFTPSVLGEVPSRHTGMLDARTNGNGEYALNDVELGAYHVFVTHPARAMTFECDARIDAAACRFDVDLPRATIEGRVVDEAGRPIANVQVWVEFADRALGRASDSWSVSSADGTYILRGVRTETALMITVNAGDYQPFESEVIRIAPGELKSGVDLQLARGAALDVLVTNADGSFAAGRLLNATYAEPDARNTHSMIATTDAGGRARFDRLRPGRWRVLAVRVETGPRVEVEVDVRLDVVNTAALELR